MNMDTYGSVEEFLDELEYQVGMIGSDGARELWYKCEDLEEALDGSLDENTLSVLNRVLQETYCHALDTFVEALRFTLLVAVKDANRKDNQGE